MVSISLKKTLIAQPSAKRNFTTHLSYDAGTNSIAYPSGKSAIVRSLDTNTVIQFTGHGSAAVTVVKFSPRLGSNYVCSGDETGKVIVWSYANQLDESAMVGTKIHSEFKVLAGAITDISWDFEGSRLCVVGEGRDKFGAFITWDTGNSLGEVTGHSNRINACHVKQSRPMRAMTVGDNGTVVFYKGPPFQFSLSDRTHHGQGSFVRDVRFSPGAGKYAISVGSDRKIVVYDGTTGQFVKHIEDTTETCGGLFALDWVDEGDNSTQFVTSSADGKVRLWNVETGKVVQMWFVGSSLLDQQVGVAVTKDKSIVSLSLDGTLSVFKMGSSDAVRTLRGHTKGITALAVNPLVTASYDGNVFKWSDNDEPCLCATHSNKVTSVEYVKGSTSTVSWDKALKVDDQSQYEFAEQPKVSCSNNGIVAVITESNKLMVLDSLAGTLLNEVTLERPGNAVTIGSKYVAVGYEVTNSIEVFKLKDLSERFVLANPLRACPSALSLSPSEEYLAAGDTMGKILLYDLKTKLVKTSRWSFHTGRITSISWRPSDGEEDHVATSSLDTHLFIYSVKRPMKVIKKLNAHKDGVNFVKWVSPDLLVSAGADACINKWTVVFA